MLKRIGQEVLVRLLRFPRPIIDYRSVRRPCIRRGTEYGGWWFDPRVDFRSTLVVSAGAGEDISFDVALANEFGATVVVIDPTPRAIEHVESALARLGQRSELDFVPGGEQSPLAYNLSRMSSSQLRLLRFALWNDDAPVAFHPPVEASHVSYSIEDWLGPSLHVNPPILRVQARRLSSLLDSADLERISILKLDIEGAELEVLEDLVSSGLRPEQILVEVDRRSLESWQRRSRARKVLWGLRRSGYGLARREANNFTFLRSGT